VLLVCLALSGCGPDLYKNAIPPIPVNEGSLAGNWLITGSLPASQGSFTSGVTLDEIGTEIMSSPSVSFRCTTPGIVAVNTVEETGNLNGSGGFTLSSPTVSGNPTASGMTIEADYSNPAPPSFGGTLSFAAPPAGCTVPSSVSYTASAISNITGTYTGQLNLMFLGHALGAAVPVTLTLAQGGYPASGGEYSETVMTGSITVDLLSCMTSGTIVQQKTVAGYLAGLQFKMNDGSTLEIPIEVQDMASTTLAPGLITLKNSTCLQGVGAVGNLVRQ
jgi:hypothetical protein